MGQTPLVNFCNQNNPRARTTRSPEPRFVGPRTSTLRIPPFGERPQIPIHVGETLPPRTAPCRNRARPPSNGPSPGTRRSGWSRPLRGASSRGFTGQGPMWLSPFDAFRRDCSRRKLRPDPIGSGTTCRELVTTLAGEASAAGAMRCACALYEPTRAGPLARTHQTTRSRGVAPPTTRLSPAFVTPGPPPTIFREEDRGPLHPRCLSSMGSPF